MAKAGLHSDKSPMLTCRGRYLRGYSFPSPLWLTTINPHVRDCQEKLECSVGKPDANTGRTHSLQKGLQKKKKRNPGLFSLWQVVLTTAPLCHPCSVLSEELDIESRYNYHYLLHTSCYIYISNLGFDLWQWAPNGQPLVAYLSPGANPEALAASN